MHVVCSKDEITIRYLEKNDEDFKLIHNWLNNESVFKYYGDNGEKELDFVKQKYSKKIENKTDYPCIIEFGKVPIGYIQFYNVTSEDYDLSKEQMSKLAKDNDKVMAIDVFIGEDSYRDRGVGSKSIKLLIKALFEQYDADVILIDPKTNNPRAIACYRKCGFQDCFIVPKREEKDGVKYDSLIMRITK